MVPDVNLLLYATNSASSDHARAKTWLESVLSGPEDVGFAWLVLIGFIRLSTRHGLYPRPLLTEQAFDIVSGWLGRPNAVILEPTARHLAVLRGLLEPRSTAGNLTNDAHLAALALEHGGVLASRDHDFGRFRGLKWLDPLAA